MARVSTSAQPVRASSPGPTKGSPCGRASDTVARRAAQVGANGHKRQGPRAEPARAQAPPTCPRARAAWANLPPSGLSHGIRLSPPGPSRAAAASTGDNGTRVTSSGSTARHAGAMPGRVQGRSGGPRAMYRACPPARRALCGRRAALRNPARTRRSLRASLGADATRAAARPSLNSGSGRRRPRLRQGPSTPPLTPGLLALRWPGALLRRRASARLRHQA